MKSPEWTKVQKNVSKAILTHCKTSGLSRRQLAADAGLSFSGVAAWARGELGDIRVTSLLRLASAMDTTVAKLLGEKG